MRFCQSSAASGSRVPMRFPNRDGRVRRGIREAEYLRYSQWPATAQRSGGTRQHLKAFLRFPHHLQFLNVPRTLLNPDDIGMMR